MELPCLPMTLTLSIGLKILLKYWKVAVNCNIWRTNGLETWLKQYKRFISVENDKEITEVIDKKRWPSIMGPTDFIDWAKGKYYALKVDDDIPQSKELAPEKDAIIKVKKDIDKLCALIKSQEQT